MIEFPGHSRPLCLSYNWRLYNYSAVLWCQTEILELGYDSRWGYDLRVKLFDIPNEDYPSLLELNSRLRILIIIRVRVALEFKSFTTVPCHIFIDRVDINSIGIILLIIGGVRTGTNIYS